MPVQSNSHIGPRDIAFAHRGAHVIAIALLERGEAGGWNFDLQCMHGRLAEERIRDVGFFWISRAAVGERRDSLGV